MTAEVHDDDYSVDGNDDGCTFFLHHSFFSVYTEVKNCGYIKENIMVSKGEYKWETADTRNPQMMKRCCIQFSLS